MKVGKINFIKNCILSGFLLVTFSLSSQNFLGWNRKQAITINNSQVAGANNLTNFPFLVTLDHLNSEIVDGGSNSALNGGGDIRFSSDAAGNNRLAIEVVEFTTDATTANRRCQIWVKIPSLSATSDTTIYIWYNKSGEVQPAATGTYGSQALWSNNYVSIWHLDDDINAGGTPLQILDSGTSSNDGVSGGNMNINNRLTSKVGDGIDLMGDNYFIVGNDASLNLTSDLTISGWFYPTTNHAGYIMAKRSETVSDGYNILTQIGGETVYYEGTTATTHYTNLADYNLNQWNYVVFKINSSGTGLTAFLNGSFSSEITISALPDGLAQNFYLGTRSYGSYRFNGAIDELRVSNIARTNDWIITEYNNQNNPLTFAIAGVPQATTSNTQAPTAPSLSSSSKTETTIDLSWTAATDDIAVTGYKVYKDATLETTLGNVLSYQITGLTASTAYNFTVTALDAAGNESLVSNIVPITTESASNNQGQELYVSNAASSVNETNSTTGWLAVGGASSTIITSDSNESYVGSYSLKIEAVNGSYSRGHYSFDTEIGKDYAITIHAKSTSPDNPGFYLWEGFSNFNFLSVTSANWTKYTFNVTANAVLATIKVYAGSPTTPGSTVYIDNISIIEVDQAPPTAPTLSSTVQTDTTADLSWTTATDNTAVTGYKVYKGAVLETTLGNVLSYQVTGLTASTAYNFTVTALDAAGNESVVSNTVAITTNTQTDTQGPTASTVSSSVQTDTTADLSWTAATDNTAVTGYKVYKDAVLEMALGNVLSYQVTGLTASTAYNFTVTALDAAGNESVVSNILAITTNATSGGGSGNWTLNNQNVYYNTGNVGIGTTTPDEKLAVNGNIHAKEVRVDLSGWPDYVFTKTYDLRTLKQVAEYIKNKGHLPNIPSAKEVEENGILLGDMNAKLLEKIEELTLYILQQQKKIDKKDTDILDLEERLKAQESRLKKIENLLNL